MPNKDTAKIIQALKAGKAAATIIAEGAPKSTVYGWVTKLKDDPSAGDKILEKAKAGAHGGDKGGGTGELEAKTEGKETQLPPQFRLRVTVWLDWDNLYFFYRSRNGGFEGDLSAYINEILREAYQMAGFKIKTVLDVEKAKELAAKYLPPEVEIVSNG